MATRDQLRTAMQRQEPFLVRLTDGRSFTIRHRDFISVPATERGRDVSIHDTGGLVLVDLLHIVSIEIPEPAPSSAEGGEA